jgi:hypothetical protein
MNIDFVKKLPVFLLYFYFSSALYHSRVDKLGFKKINVDGLDCVEINISARTDEDGNPIPHTITLNDAFSLDKHVKRVFEPKYVEVDEVKKDNVLVPSILLNVFNDDYKNQFYEHLVKNYSENEQLDLNNEIAKASKNLQFNMLAYFFSTIDTAINYMHRNCEGQTRDYFEKAMNLTIEDCLNGKMEEIKQSGETVSTKR